MTDLQDQVTPDYGSKALSRSWSLLALGAFASLCAAFALFLLRIGGAAQLGGSRSWVSLWLQFAAVILGMGLGITATARLLLDQRQQHRRGAGLAVIATVGSTALLVAVLSVG